MERDVCVCVRIHLCLYKLSKKEELISISYAKRFPQFMSACISCSWVWILSFYLILFIFFHMQPATISAIYKYIQKKNKIQKKCREFFYLKNTIRSLEFDSIFNEIASSINDVDCNFNTK